MSDCSRLCSTTWMRWPRRASPRCERSCPHMQRRATSSSRTCSTRSAGTHGVDHGADRGSRPGVRRAVLPAGRVLRRARAGFALEDYLSAYRVGQQVLWDSIVAFAEEAGVDNRVVLTLASQLMRHMNFATTHAGQAYVEFHQTGLAAVAKERRDLLEQLLAGGAAEGRSAGRRGRAVRSRRDHACAGRGGAPTDARVRADAVELAGATFSRAGLQEPPALVVIRRRRDRDDARSRRGWRCRARVRAP